MAPSTRTQFGVFGAGAIGCFLGGRLAAAGESVILMGRERLGAELGTHGLTLTDYRGRQDHLPPDSIVFRTDVQALSACDIVIVSVKSAATEEAARALAGVLRSDAVVVSFQNGVRNAATLRAGLAGRPVLAGMVAFNVLHKGAGCFHRGTSGPLVVERSAGRERALVAALRKAQLETRATGDVRRVQWAKLLLNLNNAINALSGVPLQQELRDRGYRRVLAACIEEGIACAKALGVRPAPVSGVPVRLIPYILRAPDPVFELTASAMLAVDPEARSSMWEDLERRRPTELDALNGEVVSLAATASVPTPVNGELCRLVREAERANLGSPHLSSEALLARLGLASAVRARA